MADSIPGIPIIPLEPAIPTVPSTPLEPVQTNPWEYSEIPNFYDRVRSSLNVNATIVSNEVIDYFEYAPMAENKMRQRIPVWRDLDEFKTQLFQTCIIYMTCYQLCPMVSSHGKITEQTTPSLTLKYSTSTNNDKPCERFLSLIDDLVSQILGEEPASFFGFDVTKKYPECGCRRKVIDAWNKNAFNPLWSE